MDLLKVIERIKRDSGEATPYVYPVDAGKYVMSVQASERHYCSPKKRLPVKQYKSMELAIFKGDEFVQVYDNEDFKNFDRYEELVKSSERMNDKIAAVYAYVPIDLLSDLYLFLKNHI